MASALTPIKIRELELPNRVVLAPMCTFQAEPGHNEMNDRHMVHYCNIAMGGTGLLIVEATPVEYRGRIDYMDLGIWSDRQIEGFRRMNEFVHKHTPAKTGIQLGHCGRKGTAAYTLSPNIHQLGPTLEHGSKSVAPSPLAFSKNGPYKTPTEATLGDLTMIKEAFVAGAKRAVEAGFDMVEIHSAHGYFLCSCTSPLSNQRTDQYGGSLENRCRFPLEVVAAVRAVLPKTMPLFVRLSATEWVEDGLSVEDNIYYAKELMKVGADMIHVSSGANSSEQQLPSGKHFQIPLAERIRKEAKVPVIAVGDITELDHAGAIIDEGKADMVAVGRALLANPYWLRNEAARLGLTSNAFCPQYQVHAYGSVRKAAAAAAAAKLRAAEDSEAPLATVHEMKAVPGSRKGFFVCCGGAPMTGADAEIVN